jgi:hypothetical protein
MGHDERIHPSADTFQPERYLTETKPTSQLPTEPLKYVFGFGRRWAAAHINLLGIANAISLIFRVCPGMHYADDALFIQIASILATFDISKTLDADGREIMPREVYASSTVVCVVSYFIFLRSIHASFVERPNRLSAVSNHDASRRPHLSVQARLRLTAERGDGAHIAIPDPSDTFNPRPIGETKGRRCTEQGLQNELPRQHMHSVLLD